MRHYVIRSVIQLARRYGTGDRRSHSSRPDHSSQSSPIPGLGQPLLSRLGTGCSLAFALRDVGTLLDTL